MCCVGTHDDKLGLPEVRLAAFLYSLAIALTRSLSSSTSVLFLSNFLVPSEYSSRTPSCQGTLFSVFFHLPDIPFPKSAHTVFSVCSLGLGVKGEEGGASAVAAHYMSL